MIHRSILAVALSYLAGAGAWVRADAPLRFSGVTIESSVADALIAAATKASPDAIAKALIDVVPDLHLVVAGSTGDLGSRINWRDPRVDGRITRYYANSRWVKHTLERYLPAGYAPFGPRPLENVDLLIIRDYVSMPVLLGGAVQHLIDHRLRQAPNGGGSAQNQVRSIELINVVDIDQIDPDEVARLALGVIRAYSLRQAEVSEWLLAHRAQLRLTNRQTRSLIDYALISVREAVTDLTAIKGFRSVSPTTEVEKYHLQIRALLANLKGISCSIDLN